MKVSDLKASLKKRVKNGDTVEIEDVEKVNRFARMEKMQSEMRMLADFVSTSVPEDKKLKLFQMLDVLDHLALDWVNGDEIDWDHSMAHQQTLNIVHFVNSDQA